MQLWKIIFLYYYVKLNIHTTCEPSMQLLDICLEKFDYIYQNKYKNVYSSTIYKRKTKVIQVCMDRRIYCGIFTQWDSSHFLKKKMNEYSPLNQYG